MSTYHRQASYRMPRFRERNHGTIANARRWRAVNYEEEQDKKDRKFCQLAELCPDKRGVFEFKSFATTANSSIPPTLDTDASSQRPDKYEDFLSVATGPLAKEQRQKY
jgi:hypothetical protein